MQSRTKVRESSETSITSTIRTSSPPLTTQSQLDSSDNEDNISGVMFVNEVTGSTRAKEMEIAARRAHAARVGHQRRRNRLSGGRAKPSLTTLRDVPLHSSPSQSPATSIFYSPQKRLTDELDMSEEASEMSYNSSSGHQTQTSCADECLNEILVDSARELPIEMPPAGLMNGLLDQSSTDPFASTGMEKLPRILRIALDFALEVYWPANVNLPPTDRSYSITLRRGAALHPHSFHAITASAAMLLQRNTLDQKAATERSALVKLHKTKAIKYINAEINRLEGSVPPDDLVMAMVAIVRGAVAHGRVPPESSISKSPLAKSQNLHYYTTQSLDLEYVKAFFRIIDLKGGISGIQTPALARLTELFDITIATLTGTSPKYDWTHPRPSLLTYEIGGFIIDSMSAVLWKDLGSGFNVTTHNNIYPIISMICELTIALDRFVRKSTPVPSIFNLTQARNTIQHALCRVERKLDPPDLLTAIQEACRAALLCFSDMIIFPVPTIMGVRSRLVTELCIALSACEELNGNETHHEFMLWAIMVGGIAAINLPLKVSYANLFNRAQGKAILSWEDTEVRLLNFVWWDHICTEPGRRFWAEATFLRKMSSQIL